MISVFVSLNLVMQVLDIQPYFSQLFTHSAPIQRNFLSSVWIRLIRIWAENNTNPSVIFQKFGWGVYEVASFYQHFRTGSWTGCLQIQSSKFPGDSRRDFKKNPGHVCLPCFGLPCNVPNLLLFNGACDDELEQKYDMHFIQHEAGNWKPMRSIFNILHKNFQEDQLNSRRFTDFQEGFFNSRSCRHPVETNTNVQYTINHRRRSRGSQQTPSHMYLLLRKILPTYPNQIWGFFAEQRSKNNKISSNIEHRPVPDPWHGNDFSFGCLIVFHQFLLPKFKSITFIA